MTGDDIQVPEDLGSNVIATEPPAQPDKAAPSTGTEQTAEDPTPAEPTSEADKPDEGKPTEEDKPEEPKRTPWFVERIAKQREQIAQERQQKEELTARLAAYEKSQNPDDLNPNQPPPSPAQIRAMVETEARRLAEQTAMGEKLKSFDAAGRREFPDFVHRCNTIASLGGSENPAFMSIITDMEDGPRIVAQLAENPEQAIQILQMPPLRMAATIAKLSGQAPKPPPVSKAPAPIRAVSGATHVDPDDSKLSDEAWWQKELKASKG